MAFSVVALPYYENQNRDHNQNQTNSGETEFNYSKNMFEEIGSHFSGRLDASVHMNTEEISWFGNKVAFFVKF